MIMTWVNDIGRVLRVVFDVELVFGIGVIIVILERRNDLGIKLKIKD